MKILRIISYIYMILFPNLLFRTFDMLTGLKIMSFIVALLVMLILGIFSGIVINVSAVTSEGSKSFSVMNLIVKLWYSSVHISMMLFSLGMLATIIFAFGSGIPIVLSIILLVFSGLCNIGNCVSLYRTGKCSAVKAVVLGVMGFVYVLDIIGAVIQCCTKKR